MMTRGLVDSYVLFLFVEVCKCFTNVADLAKCGFKLELFDDSETVDSKDCKSALYTAEHAKAEFMQRAMVQILRFRGLTHSQYTCLPHFNFVLLLGTGDELQLGLAKAKSAWSALQRVEWLRHSYKEVNAIWCNIPFANWEIVRQVFVMPAEHDFRCFFSWIAEVIG